MVKSSSFNALSQERGDFVWTCGNVEDVLEKDLDGKQPIYLSAMKTSIERVRELLHQRWKVGPSSKTTIDAWNSYHLHRDPNQGRSPDDPEYQVPDEKWQKQAPL